MGARAWGVLALGAPGLAAAWLLKQKWGGQKWMQLIFWTSYALACGGVARFLRNYCTQFEQLQIANLDAYFEKAYEWFFIHVDAEDLRGRWITVRPRVASILNAAKPSITSPAPMAQYEIARIDACLGEEVWYCRLLAKLLRGAEA